MSLANLDDFEIAFNTRVSAISRLNFQASTNSDSELSDCTRETFRQPSERNPVKNDQIEESKLRKHDLGILCFGDTAKLARWSKR